MEEHADPLSRVVVELERRQGDLPKVARECGLSYDTVLRIKNRENDPGYSKVRRLYAYLFNSDPNDDPAPDSTPPAMRLEAKAA